MRKRKTPITLAEQRPSSSKPHTTRTVIRRFHVLLKKQRQLQNNADELRAVEEEIDQLGGLAAYQRMSSIGQGADRGGGSEKVLIEWLVGMGLSKEGPLRLLEVGALKPDNYASCSSWITTTAIDLLSRHPSIVEQDFMTMNVDEHTERWDLVSLSLVVNFVPDPKDRGRMLTRAHLFLRASGLLFLALPLPCIENSRYMSHEVLASLMKMVGFTEVASRRGCKMGYWLYRKQAPEGGDGCRRKRACRDGQRNNFCILLE